MAGKWLTCKVEDINRAVHHSKWQRKVTVKLYLGEINHLPTSLALFWGGSVGGERGRWEEGSEGIIAMPMPFFFFSKSDVCVLKIFH